MNIARHLIYTPLLIAPMLYGCEGNSIRVDTEKKIATEANGGGFVYFTINGEKEFIQYELSFNKNKTPACIYLLKPNPDYNVTVISKDKIEEPINFVFKPIPGEKYTLENRSNGDAGAASCQVIFDSLNNITVINADTSRVHPGN